MEGQRRGWGNELLVLKLTSCRHIVGAFEGKGRTGVGNWTQKEGQLSSWNWTLKGELRVSCLNIST